MTDNQQTPYQDPKISYPACDSRLNFGDYIAQCKQIITKYRLDQHSPINEYIIEANSPFEFRPSPPNKKRYGALLIHGLFDSPFMMRDIGEKLASQGLLVRSLLLPGHGTLPGALLNVSYQEWLQTVRYGISTFEKEVDQLFLVGFSIGGALASYQALQSNTDFIAGLILLSPAFQIKSKLAFISQWALSLSKIYPRAKWLHIRKEIDYVKYQTVAFNAVYQALQLTKQLELQLKNTILNKRPQLLALSLNDKTVESRASLNYFSKDSHPNSRLILYANKNSYPNDPRIILRQPTYPTQRILDISHIAIPIASTNTHYGNQGDFPDASHTLDQTKIEYDEVDDSEAALYDLLYQLKLTRHLRRRLTFNPDFEFMMQQMIHFIEQVSA